MDIVQGRDFSRKFSADNQNYIINQAAVDFAKMDDPVGKMFSIWTNEGRIIGVVKNFHSRSLHNEIVPIVFALTRNWPHTYVFIRLNPNNIQNALNSVKSVWSDYAGSYPFDFEFLNDVFEQQYQSDQQTKTLFGYFTFLAIFISCLGLLGLAAFAAEQRTKEIGIRKTLGASVSSLIMLMTREFLVLLGIANLIAWPLAFYIMKNMMKQYAYSVDLTIWIFLFAGLLALLITTVTVSFQAVRAARANPVESLRYE
jgi:ABC-type antimicrobial peptide transport system permease subunit